QVGGSCVTGNSLPKYQWYTTAPATGTPVAADYGTLTVVPKQEPQPFETTTFVVTAANVASGNESPSTRQQGQGSGSSVGVVSEANLAEYNQSTSKGHEILSQAYQSSPIPLKLIPVKPRKYPNRPSK